MQPPLRPNVRTAPHDCAAHIALNVASHWNLSTPYHVPRVYFPPNHARVALTSHIPMEVGLADLAPL